MLEVTSTLGTAKVMRSNLTRTCVFKRKFSVSNKIFGVIIVRLCFVGLVATSKNSLFLLEIFVSLYIFIVVAFSVLEL